MTLAVVLVVLVSAALAYANGANDVSKGIATLVGSGVTDYRRAILWGSLWTGAGGMFGAVFAGAMLSTFGNGLLAGRVSPTFPAALATLAGAAGWVVLATRKGLPVSTTHAIVGSFIGVAVLAYGAGAVQWVLLGGKVVLPLLLTPLLSLVLTFVILRATRAPAGAGNAADCVCAEMEPSVVAAGTGGALLTLDAAGPHLRITSARAEACAVERPRALRLTLGRLHWLTSGATSLARGMNDAPKIAAFSLAASALGATTPLPTPVLYAVVTLAMVAGSLVAGLRVTRVLAAGITPMDDREGFTANVVTAALVAMGAVQGLPMSATHVASGGIFGAGAQRGTLDRRSLGNILLAWVVTLPAAALLGAGCYAATALGAWWS